MRAANPTEKTAARFACVDPAASARYFALVPCAGSGSRAGAAQPKQYQPIAGQPLVMHTLQALAGVARLHGGLVVLTPGDDFVWPQGAQWPDLFVRQACGGATRAHSVFQGSQELAALGVRDGDWVLVHDAARCLVTPHMVDALIDACANDPVGGLLALPLPDTLKQEVGGRSHTTVPRADKWLAQTPQMFRLGALRDALARRATDGFAGITDEASAMEMAGHAPLLVAGSAYNFKVTYPQDFALAQAILQTRITESSQ
jgi:2-C-methyl-D-erythritol 4-phosphate cytidylyltransferase